MLLNNKNFMYVNIVINNILVEVLNKIKTNLVVIFV